MQEFAFFTKMNRDEFNLRLSSLVETKMVFFEEYASGKKYIGGTTNKGFTIRPRREIWRKNIILCKGTYEEYDSELMIHVKVYPWTLLLLSLFFILLSYACIILFLATLKVYYTNVAYLIILIILFVFYINLRYNIKKVRNILEEDLTTLINSRV
jgi:hypothetical protein